MADGGALHGAFHGSGATARADIEAAQPELVPYFLRVVVFHPLNGVATPADHQIRPHLRLQSAGVSQDVENRVRDAGRGAQIEATALDDFIRDEDYVSEHRKQVILQPADHFAIHESGCGGVLDGELDAPCLADDADLEVLVLLENKARIVDVAAGI